MSKYLYSLTCTESYDTNSKIMFGSQIIMHQINLIISNIWHELIIFQPLLSVIEKNNNESNKWRIAFGDKMKNK